MPIKIGFALLAFGSGPLIAILVLSKLGVGDPNPNPVGPGHLRHPATVVAIRLVDLRL
jgi:hypothetical protein